MRSIMVERFVEMHEMLSCCLRERWRCNLLAHSLPLGTFETTRGVIWFYGLKRLKTCVRWQLDYFSVHVLMS